MRNQILLLLAALALTVLVLCIPDGRAAPGRPALDEQRDVIDCWIETYVFEEGSLKGQRYRCTVCKYGKLQSITNCELVP